jgi:hypothetical protein
MKPLLSSRELLLPDLDRPFGTQDEPDVARRLSAVGEVYNTLNLLALWVCGITRLKIIL